MGKSYMGRKGARDLERDAHEGMKIYYVNNHANMPGQFEAQTYSTLTCTHRGGLKGGWMFAHASDYHGQVYGKGNITAESAVLYMGGVSTTPPAGLRELSSPEPDCRSEGLHGYGRHQKNAIEEMERLGSEARDRYKDDRSSGRRGWGFGR
ncbi:hypothetical protein ACFXJO_05555 [Streptomyces lavendulae]|uniref:hypothetical protein n=1 Tax=Streptomyces lavendulae TaxID=1914 RepID=UPI0036C071C7